jgi:putative tricarboxylic transport membrane protein
MIGFILGPIGEKALSQGLQASNGSFSPLFTDPIALIFFLVAVLTLAFPWISPWLKKKPASTV